MTSWHYQAPSKTFLLGEYLVLNGGPALILNTNPCFSLQVSNQKNFETDSLSNIHINSPAGILYQRHRDLLIHYQIKFDDPYHGLGGLGASTAQYLLLYALIQDLENHTLDKTELLNTYKSMSWNGIGLPPSGADIMSQLEGNLCHIQFNPLKTNIHQWSFAAYHFMLIHTQQKLATHTHLNQITKIHTESLQPILQNALNAMHNNDGSLFIQCINDYGRELNKMNLVADHTQVMLENLRKNSNILAAKGCGAMGSDVIFIMYEKIEEYSILEYVHNSQYCVLYYGNKTADGLKTHGNPTTA